VYPLSLLTAERALFLDGLLFDLDDTFLTRGVLTKRAYDALWAMKDARLRLVAVTGRPSGWGEVLVRQWPIDGAVTENGAVSIVRDGEAVIVREACSEQERLERRAALAAIVSRVATVVPEARLTDDVGARRSDVTWDIGERVTLPRATVDRIANEIVRAGARTTRSSVHIHATFDLDDKASGAVRFLVDTFGEDPGRAVARYAFVGDSGNDAACFAAFRTTFGVANVKAALGRLAIPPAFVTSSAMGEGFAELVDMVLHLRATKTASSAAPPRR
jgi:hydroxymethylpyrimidine pyrophosphatase-like HAD family hydrolase